MSSLNLLLGHTVSPASYLPRSIILRSGILSIPSNGGRVRACANVDAQAPNSTKIDMGVLSKEVMEDDTKFLVGTYGRTPVVLSSGKGCKLYDTEGREYLDMTSGIAVNALGHGDPDVIKAVTEQANVLTHVSNIFYSLPQVRFFFLNLYILILFL